MRLLLNIALSFMIGEQTLAQDKHHKKIMPGFELGINYGQQQLRGSDQTAETRNGFRAGITIEKPATRRLTFVGNLSYVQAGANNVRFTTDDERLNYAEFSIKAVEYVPIGGSDLYVSLGPYVAYGINGELTNSNGQVVTKNPFDLPEYKRIDWGLGGNLGLKTPWGTYLQLGMQTAFNNFYVAPQSKYFNFSFMLTAGHTIGWRNFKT